MKVMSFNLLCGGKGERDWPCRVPPVVETIRREAPDTLGVQEAHSGWMDALCAALPEYDYVGVGREDGKRDGEFSAVFYRKELFLLVDSGNFWLSETPEKPSKGWDAACTRICSYAVLEERASGRRFVHFNTHMDHIGQTAMCEGGKLIAARSLALKEYPSIFTGDFNVEPDHPAYQTVIGAGFRDAGVICGVQHGQKTYHGFECPDRDSWAEIDYIFLRGDITATDYRVVTDKVDGKLPSDHYPVTAQIEFTR